MFKLLRLDERLIHGQVAFAWTNSLSADCILVANDGVAKDKLRATSLKLLRRQKLNCSEISRRCD